MSTNKQDRGTPFSKTATGSTSAVASQTGVANTQYYITDIAASTDKAGALLLVKDGTTVIWQLQIATTAAGINAIQESFTMPLPCTIGNLASVTVDGTAVCNANIAGFSIQAP